MEEKHGQSRLGERKVREREEAWRIQRSFGEGRGKDRRNEKKGKKRRLEIAKRRRDLR